jgi:hypothetical protein
MQSKEISIKCICCGKELKPLYEGDYAPETDMWDGAIVDRIVGGYGSIYDTTALIIGICDGCLKQKLEDGSVVENQ